MVGLALLPLGGRRVEIVGGIAGVLEIPDRSRWVGPVGRGQQSGTSLVGHPLIVGRVSQRLTTAQVQQRARTVEPERIHIEAVEAPDRGQQRVLSGGGVEQDVVGGPEVVGLQELEVLVALVLCDLVGVRGVDDVELAGLQTV